MVDAKLVSIEKVAELWDAFSQYDKDKSGTITTNELGTVMRTVGLEPTEQQLNDTIRAFDTNKNGALDFPEFLVMMTLYSKNDDVDEETREAFRVFDQDGNGLITATELKSVLLGLGEKVTDAEIAEMIKFADMDKDGKLNYTEFTKMMRMKDSVTGRH